MTWGAWWCSWQWPSQISSGPIQSVLCLFCLPWQLLQSPRETLSTGWPFRPSTRSAGSALAGGNETGALRVFSPWSCIQRKTHLLLPAMTLTTQVKCYLAGEFLRGSAFKGFIGAWSYRPPLPSTQQNSRFPGGKQVFSTSHTVYPNRLGAASRSFHFYQARELFIIRIPAGLSKDPSLRLLC